jgi:hypothetical protein
MLAGDEEIQTRWSDDDFDVRVELSVVKVGDDLLDAGDSAIPLTKNNLIVSR